jgi:molybdate/tungstate transport system substrate-binding protein
VWRAGKRRPSARRAGIAAIAAASLALAGCGSSGGGHGTVNVLYAGSLVDLMEHQLGPAFAHSQGYGYQGVGAGSTELVAQIKGHVRQGDVFISASPEADLKLEGAANGNRVRWYATFAKSPLVIGYNPHSRFATAFRSEPWYRVITKPGIRVGRTDPKLDPKGKLTVEALEEAAAALHQTALKTALSRFPVFPEEDLVGRLEAGQLDAGFFYSVEAAAQHLPTVALRPVKADATYTITILSGASNQSGARAFVAFFLGPRGRRILARNGMLLTKPHLVGQASAAPASLRSLLGAR